MNRIQKVKFSIWQSLLVCNAFPEASTGGTGPSRPFYFKLTLFVWRNVCSKWKVAGPTYQVGADSYISMGGVCHTVCTGSTTAKTASNWGQKVVSALALPLQSNCPHHGHLTVLLNPAVYKNACRGQSLSSNSARVQNVNKQVPPFLSV